MRSILQNGLFAGAIQVAILFIYTMPSMAHAQTSEANSLPCPTEPFGVLSEQNLQLNETRQFGTSGMMVRLTAVYTGEPEAYDDGTKGYVADLMLPTTTLREVTFYGQTSPYQGPILRYSLCGSTYEITSSWGHPYFGNQITIKAIPAGF